VIIDRDFNKEIWKIVRELRRAASVRQVAYETVHQIGDKLEALLKRHGVVDLNSIPSRELVGAIFASANFPWDRLAPPAGKPQRRKKDKQLLQRLQFWTKLAQEIRYKRKSDDALARSIGLSPEEFSHLKAELNDKGWLD
jgi:hypothetical protein